MIEKSICRFLCFQLSETRSPHESSTLVLKACNWFKKSPKFIGPFGFIGQYFQKPLAISFLKEHLYTVRTKKTNTGKPGVKYVVYLYIRGIFHFKETPLFGICIQNILKVKFRISLQPPCSASALATRMLLFGCLQKQA